MIKLIKECKSFSRENLFLLFLLITRNNPIILGENNQNLPRLLAIISEAFLKEAITPSDDLGKRLILIVRQVQVSSLSS